MFDVHDPAKQVKFCALAHTEYEKDQIILSHRFQVTLTLLTPHKDEVILDVGCGELAILTKFVASKSCVILAIDVNPKALNNAKSSVKSSTVHFVVASATALPFKPQSADKIAMLETIEHLPKRMESICFKQAGIVLKNGGSLVLSTPNDSNLLINLLDPHWLMGHRHYKPEPLKQLLISNEFKVQTLLMLGGLLDAFCYLLYLPWHLLWSHLLRRKEPPLPFQSVMHKLSVSDYSRLGVHSTHIFLKAIKVSELIEVSSIA